MLCFERGLLLRVQAPLELFGASRTSGFKRGYPGQTKDVGLIGREAQGRLKRVECLAPLAPSTSELAEGRVGLGMRAQGHARFELGQGGGLVPLPGPFATHVMAPFGRIAPQPLQRVDGALRLAPVGLTQGLRVGELLKPETGDGNRCARSGQRPDEMPPGSPWEPTRVFGHGFRCALSKQDAADFMVAQFPDRAVKNEVVNVYSRSNEDSKASLKRGSPGEA